MEEKIKLMEKEYIPIYKILSTNPMHINEIAKKLNTTIQDIMPIITMMEINGYIYQVNTNYFIKKE